MPGGRPSIRSKPFWKTQLAQYDPANYGTELEYHQVFAEKFTKSFEKLKPSIKKFISDYYKSHKAGADESTKSAFYRVHAEVFPENIEPAPAKGPDPNVAAQQAISDVQVARGQRPDRPGAKRKWGDVDVNAPSDASFVSTRKKDLMLSLFSENDEASNPSNDPKEKEESKEDAFELNQQKNTSLAPETHNQDPGQMSRGQREKAAEKGIVSNLQQNDRQMAQERARREEDAYQVYVAQNAAHVSKNAYFATAAGQLEKQRIAAAVQNMNPNHADIAKAQLQKFDVQDPTAPRTQRQTETETVRGKGSTETSVQAAFARFGDALVDTETVDTATPSLRPQYGLEGASAVVPSTAKQLASDLSFDMFSWVNRGFGNGSDNKLFLQQEAHDKFVRYAGEMYGPGPHPGPISGIAPMPMAWAPVKPKGFIDNTHKIFNRNNKLCARVYNANVPQNGTALALPDDIGSNHLFSSQELPRKMNSPLEPVYNNYSVFRPVRDGAGFTRDARKLARHLHDPIRDPFNTNFDTQSGIPRLPKQLGMQEILA